ncbi:MAG: RluA family pseudouridine synthase [Campylobacter sp.]|nr:RluA family pseudouridine synthase [Campylobacter sp.]
MENFKVDEEIRLDKFVSNKLNSSRNQVISLIKDGNIKVNGKISPKPSLKLKFGDLVQVSFPEPKFSELKPKFTPNFDIEILYEDDQILVINKPAGLTVHGALTVKEASLVDWLKSKNYTLSNLNGDERLGIVHRIDKATTGALLIAKTNHAHAHLATQLADKSMGRYYLALINLPLKENIIIDAPIARNPKNRLKNAVVDGGKVAKSAFCNLYNDENINLISAKLFTGRTHQIRVHLSHINRYILGDNLYGFKSQTDKIKQMMLHAYILYFVHPISQERMFVMANLPIEFKNLIAKNKEQIYEKLTKDAVVGSFDDYDEWVCIK